jgi:hypothetical protein
MTSHQAKNHKSHSQPPPSPSPSIILASFANALPCNRSNTTTNYPTALLLLRLPFCLSGSGSTADNTAAATLAILLDPVIAGGDVAAAIQMLREWGVQCILVLSILGSNMGVRRVAEVWPQGIDVWVGAVDPTCDQRRMIVPGLGDRLFMRGGKM